MPFFTPLDDPPDLGARLRGACEEIYVNCAGWGRRPAVRFVILGQGRSGSTLLTSSLDSHPEIRCADEILRFPRLAPLNYVERDGRRVSARAFGFHVKPTQLRNVQGLGPAGWPGFVAAMHARGWRIIHLWRENALAQFLSWERAKVIGRTHVRSRGELSKAKVRLDPDTIVRRLGNRVCRLEEERAALRDLPHVDLSYERDLRDAQTRERALDRVLAHIDMPRAPMSSPLLRMGLPRLSDMIENYDEIAAALAGTPHRRFLDPDPREAPAAGP